MATSNFDWNPAALALAILIVSVSTASAEDVTHFDLPAQPLAISLKEVANQSNINVLFDKKLVAGLRANALKADLTPSGAIDQLLKNTRLTRELVDDHTVVIDAALRKMSQLTPLASSPADPSGVSSDSTPPTPSQAANASAGTAAALEEVTVTATRQSEAADKVPISLSAYTNDALDVRGFRDATDLFLMTPGVNYSSGGFLGSNSISIRGISSGSGASTVGIYIDDTPIQITALGYDPTSAFPKLFDLDRVEILRGPQGTLFGASSEGGTIRFITPQPSLAQWTTFDRVEMAQIDGGGQSYEVGAAGGGPIIDGTLGFRVSADYRHDGGWIDRYNELSGQLLESNSNYANDYVIHGAVLWAVTDNFKVTPSIMYQRTNLNDQNAYWEYISDPSKNIYRSMDPLASPDPDYFFLPALNLDYTSAGFEVISNTSWFNRGEYPTADYSLLVPGVFAENSILPQIPNYRAYANFEDTFHTLVEDVRIQSIDQTAKLKWTFGVYYNDARETAAEQIIDRDFPALIELLYGGTIQQITGESLIDGQYSVLGAWSNQNRELASYGEVGYELLPGLRATVGLRVSRILLWDSLYNNGPFNFGLSEGESSSTERAITPKYNLSWQINDANLVYATMDKGFRPGGSNTALSAACLPQLEQMGFTAAPSNYNSDSLWNYEVGTKDRLFGGNAEVTASLFRINWNAIQQSVYLVTCGQSFNDNLGQAVSEGFDFSLNQRIGPFLYLAQVGYTDANYSKNLVLTPGTLPIVRDGSSLQAQPWTISLGTQYNFDVMQHSSLVRLDFTDDSGFRLPPQDDPTTSSYSPDYRAPQSTTYFNLRTGTNFGNLALYVFANNVFNAHPILTGYTNGGTQFFEDVTLNPRTIGVTVEYRR